MKYNRSKAVREMHEQGLSNEEIYAKCIEMGDPRPDVLKHFVNFKVKQIESKKTVEVESEVVAEVVVEESVIEPVMA